MHACVRELTECASSVCAARVLHYLPSFVLRWFVGLHMHHKRELVSQNTKVVHLTMVAPLRPPLDA
jgi:hypothetical protein